MTALPFSHRFIVFDVDGTLLDSQHTVVHCMSAAFVAEGLPAPAAAAIRATIGLKLDIAIASLLPDPDQARALQLVEGYRTAFFALQDRPEHNEPLFPGTLEMLDALVHPEVFLGIATGKNRRGLDRVLQRHGLAPRFHNFKTADDGPGKPHPHLLEVAMAEVGAAPEQTVMIGDTTYDIEMARAAGCVAVGVNWGNHEEELLLEAGAHCIIGHFSELSQSLVRLSGEPT
ncbi:MAG: HAD-IA family hydrolase [Kiloniellaceae bacterium]